MYFYIYKHNHVKGMVERGKMIVTDKMIEISQSRHNCV